MHICAINHITKYHLATICQKNSVEKDTAEGSAGVDKDKGDANATEADLHKRMVSSENVEVTLPHLGQIMIDLSIYLQYLLWMIYCRS